MASALLHASPSLRVVPALLPSNKTQAIPRSALRISHRSFAPITRASVDNEASATQRSDDDSATVGLVSGSESHGMSRRSFVVAPAAAVALAVTSGATAESADAFALTGPKEWLKAQKRKSMQYLLNPLAVSAERLAAAKEEYMSTASSPPPADLSPVIAHVRDASLDCLAPGFAPGVELCTFKLILKNSSSLLDDYDAAKLKGEDALLGLVGSFTELHLQLEEAQEQQGTDRGTILSSFSSVEKSLAQFEDAIREVFAA